MTLLCKVCVSAAMSAYPERVAEKLAAEMDARNKKFNIAAAAYALDLAKALGLVTHDNVLSDKGQLVNLIATVKDGEWEEQLRLSASERYLYFRLFVEGDGAALRYLAQRLQDDGVLPGEGSSWNKLATHMFIDVYSSYLPITNNTADRVALRSHRDRIAAKGHEGRGGEHKIIIHLQTLYRLGLAIRESVGRRRIYRAPEPAPDGHNPLTRFCEELPNVVALERVIQKKQWADVAARVYGVREGPSECEEEDVLALLVPHYLAVTGTGAPLCPLSTIVEAAQIEGLAASRLLTFDVVMEKLSNLQKSRPKDVRFHVDRQGKPAFLKLSDTILTEYSSQDAAE